VKIGYSNLLLKMVVKNGCHDQGTYLPPGFSDPNPVATVSNSITAHLKRIFLCCQVDCEFLRLWLAQQCFEPLDFKQCFEFGQKEKPYLFIFGVLESSSFA